MKTAAFCLVLLVSLIAPLTAQDSPLVVRTSDPGVAMGLQSQFGAFEPMPSLESGQHYVLTLGEGGIEVTTGSGDVGLMQVDARPGPLMEMFSEEIDQYLAMGRMMAMMSLGQQGIDPGDAMGMIQGVLGFPNQIESLGLQITGDPTDPEQGFTAELSLEPTGQSWFATLVDALAPVSSGAPVLDVDGAMQGSLALGMKSTEPIAPFMSVLSAFGSGSDEDKAKRLKILQKTFDIMTGAMAMGWDLGGGGMQMIAALKDADAMREIMADPAYAEWTASGAGAAGMEVDYEAEAFEHRGVKVAKMSVDLGGMPNPLAPGGTFQSFYAVAGDYSLTSTYATDDASIKALIDSVLDQKVKRSPLPGNSLGTFTVQVADVADMFVPGGVGGGDTPETLAVQLDKVSGKLVIRVDVK